MRQVRTRDRDTYYLSNAHRNGDFIRVTCGGCSPPRIYAPEDLITLFGDVAVMDLDEIMRCERCGDGLRVRAYSPTGAEKNGLVVRRIAEIKMVRKVRWREERL